VRAWCVCVSCARCSYTAKDTEAGDKVSSIYIAAYYFCFTTMTTVGYGDIVPYSNSERIVTVCLQVCGGFIMAWVIASLTSIVTSEDANAEIMNARMDAVASYVHCVPGTPARMLFFKSACVGVCWARIGRANLGGLRGHSCFWKDENMPKDQNGARPRTRKHTKAHTHTRRKRVSLPGVGIFSASPHATRHAPAHVRIFFTTEHRACAWREGVPKTFTAMRLLLSLPIPSAGTC